MNKDGITPSIHHGNKHLPGIIPSLIKWLYGGKDSTLKGAEQLMVTEVIEVNSIVTENRSLDIPETLI